MSVVIEDPEVVREIERRAAAFGQTPAEVVASALRRERPLSKVRPNDPSVEEVMALVRSFGWTHKNDHLTEDEILGYGPDGLPE